MSRAPRPAGTSPSGFPASSRAFHSWVANCGRHEELEAVLARVAGARERGTDARHFPMREPVVPDGGEIDRRQALHNRRGLRPLHGDQGITIGGVHDRHLAGLRRVLRDPGVVLLDVRGVDDEQIVLLGEAVDQHVVDECAFGRGECRVLRLAVLQLRCVVRRDVLDGGQRIGTRQLDLPHVRDVEEAGRGAHGHVLGGDARVLDRHVPAAERHHPRSEGDVSGMERGLLEARRSGVVHAGSREVKRIRRNVLRRLTRVKDAPEDARLRPRHPAPPRRRPSLLPGSEGAPAACGS